MKKKIWFVGVDFMNGCREFYPKLYEEIIKEDYNLTKKIWIKHNINPRDTNNGSNRIITKKERYEVLKRQFWKCNICGCILKYGKNSKWNGEIAHIDHIFPYSKREEYSNGAENINESSNLQALCPICNLTKSKKEIQ